MPLRSNAALSDAVPTLMDERDAEQRTQRESLAPADLANVLESECSRIASSAATPSVELKLAWLVRDARIAGRPEIAAPRIFSLLLALRPEVSRVALLAAISTSAANARAAGVGETAERALVKFYPASTSGLMLSSARYRRLVPAGAVTEALIAFHDATLAAMNQTMAVLADRACARSNPPPGGGSPLAEAWRSASVGARELLDAIDHAMSVFHVGVRASEHELLLAGLDSAIAGGTPFMSAAGTFHLPDWAERRREPRIAVECRGTLLTRTARRDVRITDISAAGAGIEGAGRLAEGERVVLSVDQAVVLPASVIWSTPMRAGLAFDRQLADDDPASRFLAALSG